MKIDIKAHFMVKWSMVVCVHVKSNIKKIRARKKMKKYD